VPTNRNNLFRTGQPPILTIGASPALTDAAISGKPLAMSALARPGEFMSTVAASALAVGGAGINEIAGRRSDERTAFEQKISTLETLAQLADETYERWATERGRNDAALTKSIQNAVVEMATAEAKDAIGAVPLGKVLLISFELSNAFAVGVGEAMLQTQAKARQDSAQPRNVVDEAIYERQWQQRAVQALPNVLLKGLASVAAKAIELMFARAEQTLKAVVKDLAGHIAKQLPKRCDLFGVMNAAVGDAATGIPPGRRGVERITFHLVSSIFVHEYGGPEVAKRLAPIISAVNSKEPVDVGLINGLIQVITNESYRTYKAFVPVDKAIDLVRGDLIDAARGLILRAREAGHTVDVPAALNAELTRPGGAMSQAEFSRFIQRSMEFAALKQRLNKQMHDVAQLYQRKLDILPEEKHDDERIRLHNRLADRSKKGYQTLQQEIKVIISEFGAYSGGIPTATFLTADGDRQLQMMPIPELQ